MSASSLALSIGLIVCLAGTGLMYWSIRRKVRLHTGGRVPLSAQEFAQLFPGNEIAALSVREALEGVIPGDIRLVRPTDHIVADLMIGTVDGLDTNQVREDVERLCHITIPDSAAESVSTVGELVNVAAQAMSEQSNQPLHPTTSGGLTAAVVAGERRR